MMMMILTGMQQQLLGCARDTIPDIETLLLWLALNYVIESCLSVDKELLLLLLLLRGYYYFCTKLSRGLVCESVCLLNRINSTCTGYWILGGGLARVSLTIMVSTDDQSDDLLST